MYYNVSNSYDNKLLNFIRLRYSYTFCVRGTGSTRLPGSSVYSANNNKLLNFTRVLDILIKIKINKSSTKY